MKKLNKNLSSVMVPILLFFAFTATASKTTSVSVAYAVCAILSLIIFATYLFLVKKRSVWFTVLFFSITIVNTGYFCLSISTTLEEALLANRIAYLGSVLLPLSMLFIILNVTNIKYKTWLPNVLVVLSAVIFAIAASPGYSTVYYKKVSFEIIDGVATLIKEYGPLHKIYYVYLLGYFAVMLGLITRAIVKKTTETTTHAIFLTIATFINILVWLIEQFISIEFEILSVSYVICSAMMLSVNFIMHENQRLRELVREKENALKVKPYEDLEINTEQIPVDNEQCEMFCAGVETLTQTERKIYDSYIKRITTKEIMASLNITENTLKFHNKNIYSKLGVGSRKELIEIYKQLNKKH